MIVSKDLCCGCHACYSICPKNCIRMEADKMGFLSPVIDEEKCIQCHLCEKVCPILNENIYSYDDVEAFGGYILNPKVREESSSGGIFYALANEILKKKGKVYGAAYSKSLKRIKHIGVESEDNIINLQGSKYVQSVIGNCYKEVLESLLEKRTVLFSGTPCQIDGLNLFLKNSDRIKDVCIDDLLITVEVICHGVPSPQLYVKYMEAIEKKLGDSISSVSFRDEEAGEKLTICIKAENGNTYRKDKDNDLYYRMFLKNMCLRESCYRCPSRGLKKRSDITIADFWGVEELVPELAGGKVSLVLIHTDRGKRIFEEIKRQLTGISVPFDKAIRANSAFFVSYRRPFYRGKLERDIERLSLRNLYFKYSCLDMINTIYALLQK